MSPRYNHGCSGCIWCDFHAQREYLEHARDAYNGRPIANNTRLCRIGEQVHGIRLHSTYIATFVDTGEVEFNTGGWDTVTTKDRMNRVCDFRVYSAPVPEPSIDLGYKHYRWVITSNAHRDRWWEAGPNDRRYIFEDGIRFDPQGYADATLYDERVKVNSAARAEDRKWRRQRVGLIQKFTNATMAALQEGIPLDSEDCADPTQLAAFVQRLEPSAPLTMRIVGRTLGDSRAWLNVREREDGELVIGPVAPIAEPHVRKKLRAALTKELVR